MDRRAEIDAVERAVILRHLEKAHSELGGRYIPPRDNVTLYELRRLLKEAQKTLNQKLALSL